MVNFPEPEEKRAIFTSNQKSMWYVHITHSFLFQMFYLKSTIVVEHVWIKTEHLDKNQLREKYLDYLLKKYKQKLK